MPHYLRLCSPGGTYFFTVTLLDRQGNNLLTRHIDLLRQAFKAVRENHPFKIHAWVVLPDHLHCVIELPEGDADYATRWRLIIDLPSAGGRGRLSAGLGGLGGGGGHRRRRVKGEKALGQGAMRFGE